MRPYNAEKTETEENKESKKIISLLLVIAAVMAVMSVAVVSASAKTQDVAETGDNVWYVRGDFNNWGASNDFIMSDDDNDGIFVLKNVAITAGQMFKVAANGGWSTAYPNDNFKVALTGSYDIYFNSANHAVYLEEAALTGTGNTVYFTDTQSWGTACVYFWGTNNDPQWPGYLMTPAYVNEHNQQVYKVVVPTDVSALIFNDNNVSNHQTVNIESGIQDGMLWYPTGEKDGNNFKVESYDNTQPAVKGYTLSLLDEIAVNFYVYVDPADYPNGFTATYSYGTDDYRTNHTDLVATVTSVVDQSTHNNANYMITCMVNARSMTDDVTMTLSSGGNDFLTDEQSVCGYAKAMVDAYPAYKDLICNMLTYGGAVQNYYEYYGSENAYDVVQEIDQNWLSPNPHIDDSSIIKTDSFKDIGLTYVGSTLMVTSKTAIRLYFTADDPTAFDGARAYYDNDIALPFKDGKNMKYIEISGIAAKDIFNDYIIKISKDGQAPTASYSASNYCKAVLYEDNNIGGEKKEELKAIVKAMYNYSKAAALLG